MASDVSFRLPSYDSPAVYHLQSDLDCSASEYEDTASNAVGTQLDRISKEQLHSAYKKASDRYQKYRSRYTEIAARYRDLERDNNKARSVLVETQDKALRRISELREQCALEQQAKAHLESALRLEMDDMQCVIKTLKSKLTTVADDTQAVVQNCNGEDAASQPLVDLSPAEPQLSSSERLELEEKIRALENVVELYKTQIADEQQKHEARNTDVKSLEEKVRQLSENLNESMVKITGLQAREDENTILLAENKMVVHSELESKDEEVKSLRERIQQMETLHAQVEEENKSLQAKVASFASQVTELESVRHDKEAKLNELEAAKIKLKEEASRMDSQLANAIAEKESLRQHMEEAAKDLEKSSASSTDEMKTKTECIERMETELIELKTQLKLKEQEMMEQVSRINQMEKQHQQLTNEGQKKKAQEVTGLNEKLKQLQDSLTLSTDENQKLAEDLKMTKVINENSESEAIQSLQATMARQQEEWEVKMKLKEDHIGELNKQVKEYEVKSEALHSEWDTLKQSIETHDEEMATVKGRIETLRSEKKDLEKTLEKEIRDKNELSTQVTNILQEISRLEGQLNESKDSLSTLEEEKSQLQEKVDNLEQEAALKLEQSMSAIDGQVQTLEEGLRQVERVRQELAEQNGRLQEQVAQLEKTHAEMEEKHKLEISAITGEVEALKGASELAHGEQQKLKECLGENTYLLQEKERLEQSLRTVEDQLETKEKEKMCVQDTNQSLEAELKTAKRDIFVMKDKILGLEQQLETATEKSSELEFQLEESLGRVKAAEESKVATEEQLASLQKQHTEGDQQKLKECLQEKEKLEHALNTIKDTNQSLETEIKTAKRDIFVMKDKILGLEQQLETATEKSSELDFQLVEIRQELEESVGRVKAAEESKVATEEQLEHLQKQLAEIEYRHKRADEETQKGKSDLEKELKDMDNVKVENEYLNTHVKQLETDLQTLRAETVQREAMIRELKEKYNFAENEMSSLQEQKSKFDCLMADKNDELDQTNVQLATVKQELEGVRVTNKTQLNNLAEEVKELKSEISAKQIIISDLNKDLSRQEKELGQAKIGQTKEIEDLQKTNEALKNEVKELSGHSSAQEELREQKENLDRLNAELQLKISELEVRLEDNVVQKSKVELEQSGKAGEMDEMREENETLKLRFHNLEKTLNSKLGVLDEKHKDLIEENRTLKEQVAKGNAQVVEGWEQERAEMEQRLQKIIAEVQEVSSRNMFLEQKCENFLVLEQTNERMKSVNDKLSRQLDETLVSGLTEGF